MANLVSPGVQVSVIDESFYTPAEPGTTPMIFVITAQDKQNGSGTATAAGTTKAKAGTPYLITSQRELTETFGDPTFYTDSNNNPIHGGELNEYGLQAAYSYLGVANRAYVTRADVNTSELIATATAPAANPAAGTYWFDTGNSRYGIFEWNGASATTTGGQSFTNKIPYIITDKNEQVGNDVSGDPKPSVGAVGDYALVTTTTVNKLFYKNSDGNWVKVGTSAWVGSHPAVTGSQSNPTVTGSATMVINSTTITASGTTLADVVSDINGAGISGVSAKAVNGRLAIFSTTNNVVVAEGTGLAGEVGITAATYYLPKLEIAPHTNVPEFKSTDTNPRPTGSVWFKTTESNLGARIKVKNFNGNTNLWTDISAPIYPNNMSALKALDSTGGGLNLAVGTLYVMSNTTEAAAVEADFKIYRRKNSGATTITSSIIAAQVSAGTYAFTISESTTNSNTMTTPVTVSITPTGASTDSEVLAAGINGAGLTNVSASVDSSNRVVISHNDGGDIRFVDTNGGLALYGFSAYVSASSGTANLYFVPGTNSATNPKQFLASNWQVLTYTASANAPTALTTDNTLWYSSVIDEVDLMIHNGTDFVGYQNYQSGSINYNTTDPLGPQVSATAPTTQSDASTLVEGDIWISTAVLENYPMIYVWNATTLNGY